MRTRKSGYEKTKKRKHTTYERSSQAETIRAIQRAHDRIVGQFIHPERKPKVKKAASAEIRQNPK